ncbi:MAG: polysaccharide deacetylase family protein [Verrucomicrobiota bacterium]|nr:polysaccharide deacetylase family protein [Verrucomicrobiota bacterium]
MTCAEATTFPIFAATAEAEKLPAVVSIHDVAPSTRAASEKIVADLSRRGIAVSSLLVVPDYHHTGSSMADRSFVQWLRDLESAGHEVVIHGYFHARARRAGESLRERLVTRFYTNDEGEFYDLPYDEAYRRVSQAREEFVSAGLVPRGFIAPAWLLGADAQRAVADAEMEYTTRLTNVRNLRNGKDFAARSLVYSVRSAWRRGASLAWNAALARAMSGAELLRLAIHPPDIQHEQIWRQIGVLAQSIGDRRTPTTYRDWIADRRLRSSRDA